ncbi:MAG: hypothetical protein HFI64_13335 [Lachnospiraceae bacterium]|nr:hypothetical protein [Lachnospiraceae bacterium]
MNHVEKLTDEELTYICNLITGKEIKKYFQNNPQKFSKIYPGFRPNGISEKKAVRLMIRYRNEPFIVSFVNDRIVLLLKEINTQKNDLIKEGKDSESALLLTLLQTVFSERLDLYFKIVEQSCSEEYIRLAKSAVQLLSVKQENALSAVLETEKGVDSVTLNEQLSNAKAEWEASEDNYIRNIEELEVNVEKTRQKLADTEMELEQAKVKIEGLEAELIEINKLEKKSVFSGEMVCDAEYPFTSLCKVVHDYERRLRLARLSDIKDGVILGSYLSDAPAYNKLYIKEKQTPGSEGFVGVWDWRVVPNLNDPTKDYILSVYKEKYVPAEIIIVQDCSSMNELLEKLKYGIMDTIVSRKMLFVYWNENGIYEGVFCTPKDLDITENRVKLKSNVFSLPEFLLTSEDMFAIDRRYFHRRFNLGRPSKIIRVKNPLEIVKDILMQRTTWMAMKQKGFAKIEYQNFNSFLRELPTDGLYEEIADACECSMTEAKGFVEQFIETADQYLHNSDLEGEVLSCCVKNHPTLMEACEGLVAEKWKEKNALQIAEANEAFEHIQEKTVRQSEFLEQLDKEYTETKEKLDDVLRELGRQEQLAADVEKEVSDRIERAKSHAAEFVANMAFQFPIGAGMVAMPRADIPAADFLKGEYLPMEELELNHDWTELKETIRFEFFEAGVSETYAEALGAYMYAAYVNHVPLLLAGPCARDIADAFSAALFGCMAATLRLEGNYSNSIMEQCFNSEEKIIAIENLFCSAWNPYLPEIIADKNRFYIGIHPFSEDLLIEPNSLFYYMVPLLTEHFVDKHSTRKFVGGCMTEGFQHYTSAAAKPYHNKLFCDMKMGILGRNLVQQILTDMHIILEDDSFDYDYIFAILPYAYVCDRIDVLRSHLFKGAAKESLASSEVLSYIHTYLGETE